MKQIGSIDVKIGKPLDKSVSPFFKVNVQTYFKVIELKDDAALKLFLTLTRLGNYQKEIHIGNTSELNMSAYEYRRSKKKLTELGIATFYSSTKGTIAVLKY